MEWSDGSYYEGEWQKGLQSGHGRLVLPDGRVKAGLFKNNKFQGVSLGTTGAAKSRPKNTTQVAAIEEEDEEVELIEREALNDYIPP